MKNFDIFFRGVEVSKVRLGEADLSSKNENVVDYETQEFIKHPNYNSITNFNDIALIKLKVNVKFSKNIRPACLHQKNDEILTGQNAIAIGFGRTSYGEESSEVLLKVNLTVVHKSKCTKINNGIKLESQLCLKGNMTKNGQFADTCQGN